MPLGVIIPTVLGAWAVVPIMIAALLLPIALSMSTGYELTDMELQVRSGFGRDRIPLADIRSIKPTRNPMAAPALSLNRLEVRHGRGSVLISPVRQQEFLDAIRARCPGLQG